MPSALLAAKADQREADMADRRIGHQPLDVGLPDGREGAKHHRGDRQEDDDLLPLRGTKPAARACVKRSSSAMAATFGAPAKNAVTGVGAPSIDVRRPHMERHGRNFEREPDEHEHEADDQADVRAMPSAFAAAAIAAKPVEPVKP